MAKLELCFRSEKDSMKRRPLTQSEINELSIAALGIAAIAEVMQEYACNFREDKARDAVDNCMNVFTILEWLIEPVENYLANYAGEPAAGEPEEEPEQTA